MEELDALDQQAFIRNNTPVRKYSWRQRLMGGLCVILALIVVIISGTYLCVCIIGKIFGS